MQDMQAQMLEYFTAEKREALVFLLIGVAACIVSAYLLATGNVYKGIAIPLLLVAAIQFLVGGSVYFRTDSQVAALTSQLAAAPADFKAEETARLQVVVRNFKVYKIIEIALVALGIALSYAFMHNVLVYGIAIGLIGQASLMLVLDLFAERRADLYFSQVQHLPV